MDGQLVPSDALFLDGRNVVGRLQAGGLTALQESGSFDDEGFAFALENQRPQSKYIARIDLSRCASMGNRSKQTIFCSETGVLVKGIQIELPAS